MTHDGNEDMQKYSHSILRGLNEAQRQAIASVRQPPWLILFSALLIASFTLLIFYKGPDSMRKFLAIGIAGLYYLTWVLWSHVLRKRGVVVRTFPRSPEGKMFVLGGGILQILVIIVAAALLDSGMQLAPWLAALVNGIAFAFVNYRYPTAGFK
jgi:hypothetical protein